MAEHAPDLSSGRSCRFCGTPLKHTFVDLGTSPLCQRHVTPAQFNHAESVYPLHAYVCHGCFLVQLPQYVARDEIFDGDYAYFSSFSETMLAHVRHYVGAMTDRFGLNKNSHVVEVASNDGYLLQYFVQRGIPCLGIEPTANTAAAAEKKGVKSLNEFFGRDTAKKVRKAYGPADLLLGNNVLAHVPDINDFVGGAKLLLADNGVVTYEFPVLSKLIENNYFDTIYHEHFSYLSMTVVEKIFAAHGLRMFDVDEIANHGGSIRVYGCHENAKHETSPRIAAMREHEADLGTNDLAYYEAFGEKVRETKRKLLEFLIEAKRDGKTIAAYGAPGKGNTLLNYCGIRTDFIDYAVDRSPHKQGNYLPGTRIPILSPDEIIKTKPDYLFLLVWNLKDEVMKQMEGIRRWGGKFIVPLPAPQILD